MIDNAESALAKICEGNPGAINACCCIIKEGAKVYPYVDGWEYIILLDKLEIYGSDIYVLWNDICQRRHTEDDSCIEIAKNRSGKSRCSQRRLSSARLFWTQIIARR